jgi:glycerophosphoryl diester phosphodiesterase
MTPFWKVAHRGWHKFHIENTLEAFRAAYDAGCDMVEFDVQLSRDGVPVVFHDDDCKRLAGRRDNVFDLDWKDLQALRMPASPRTAVPGKPGAPPDYRIPSLEQFLGEFGSKPFYLELKIPKAVAGNRGYVEMLGEKCAKMVRAAGAHPDTFLGSFHGEILRYVAKEKLFPVLAGIFEDYRRFEEVHSGEDAETAVAIRHFSVSWDIFRKYIRESAAAADRVARHAKIKPSELDLLTRKSAGVPGPELFLIWDIKGEKDFRAALNHGVRGLVADDVETLVRL